MKIAVTGASGFIGRHVARALERDSIETVLVYRCAESATTHAATTRSVVLDLKSPPQDAFALLGRPDALIHLAWGGLPHYGSLHHFADELPAQYRFLNLLVASGLRTLVVSGSCLEYGLRCGALNETLEAQPTTAYGHAKDALRRQLEFLQRSIPFNLSWARLFYLFGEGQAPTSLLPQLKMAVSRGEEVFNMSGGEQLRDFMPVEDAARDLVCLARDGRNNGIVNVCSGRPISVRRIVEGWIEQNRWSIRMNLGHYPYPEYESMAFWGDRGKLETCLHGR